MNPRLFCCLLPMVLFMSLMAEGQATSLDSRSDTDVNAAPKQESKVPAGVILVKGASPSASDTATPLPEGGTVAQGIFSSPYFGITYSLPQDWIEEYEGPPPSETGRYVLAQVGPAAAKEGPSTASMVITAQDMFFTPLPAANALELTEYVKDHLPPDYKVQAQPMLIKIANRAFNFFAYWSPVAELHWYVLAIQIRCHVVQFVLTSRDTKLLDHLMLDLNKMTLPAEFSAPNGDAGPFPVCIKDYAREENVITRVDPVFSEHRFNPVPVRIIIDKQGSVKHIHFISAFPDQAKAIGDALEQWKFKPYIGDGKPAEVETGILFGRVPRTPAPHAAGVAIH
jgi:hypothetical protein